MLAKIVFKFVLWFHKICGDLKRVLNGFHWWNIVLVLKFVLSKISLTWYSAQLNMLSFVAFLK